MVAHVRPRVDARWVVANCEDAGCWLSLDDLPKQGLLIQPDQPAASGVDREAMCDFLWFDDQDRTAAIELKSGGIRVRQVVKQLQNGADFAASRLVGYGRQVRFRPILAYDGKGDKRSTQDLRKKAASQIRFRKKPYEIKIVPCRSSLENAL